MIHSLEDKNKKELVEICKIHIEEYQLLGERIAELEWLLEYKNAVIDAQEEYHRKAKGGAE
jgi:hypothetical protein|tara:strand:- start:350 stop:532 length:183 start_codon:yes stop_codon:yes gene_type:complete